MSRVDRSMPAGGAILLGQIATLTTHLTIACSRCDRRGRLSVARLLAEHGPSMPLTQLRRVLAADCPRLDEDRAAELCRAHYPELPALMGLGQGGTTQV